MDTHDVSRGRGDFDEVLRGIKQPTLVVSIDSDVLYCPRSSARSRRIARARGSSGSSRRTATTRSSSTSTGCPTSSPTSAAARRRARGGRGRWRRRVGARQGAGVAARAREGEGRERAPRPARAPSGRASSATTTSRLRVVGVADPRGATSSTRRASTSRAGATPSPRRRSGPFGAASAPALLDRLARLRAPVLVDLTAADGMEAVYAEAFRRGVHVVTANKRPLAAPRARVERLAAAAARARPPLPLRDHRRREPAAHRRRCADLVRSGDRVRRIEGSLSGTLGYVTSELDRRRRRCRSPSAGRAGSASARPTRVTTSPAWTPRARPSSSRASSAPRGRRDVESCRSCPRGAARARRAAGRSSRRSAATTSALARAVQRLADAGRALRYLARIEAADGRGRGAGRSGRGGPRPPRPPGCRRRGVRRVHDRAPPRAGPLVVQGAASAARTPRAPCSPRSSGSRSATAPGGGRQGGSRYVWVGRRASDRRATRGRARVHLGPIEQVEVSRAAHRRRSSSARPRASAGSGCPRWRSAPGRGPSRRAAGRPGLRARPTPPRRGSGRPAGSGTGRGGRAPVEPVPERPSPRRGSPVGSCPCASAPRMSLPRRPMGAAWGASPRSTSGPAASRLDGAPWRGVPRNRELVGLRVPAVPARPPRGRRCARRGRPCCGQDEPVSSTRPRAHERRGARSPGRVRSSRLQAALLLKVLGVKPRSPAELPPCLDRGSTTSGRPGTSRDEQSSSRPPPPARVPREGLGLLRVASRLAAADLSFRAAGSRSPPRWCRPRRWQRRSWLPPDAPHGRFRRSPARRPWRNLLAPASAA